MSHIRVSIITIFKNEERFLPEAVGSVLAQTYDDWEYFLVDDGSTDGSTSFAQRLASRCANVHYIEHQGHANLGMSASRNGGLAASTGDVVAMLDADDVWMPDKLARQVAVFQNDPSLAMLYGAPLYWYGWTGHPDDVNRDRLQDIGAYPGQVFEPPDLVGSFLSNPDSTPCTCDLMVRRSIAERVGGFENDFVGLYEDQAFCVKVALTGRIRIGPRALSRYRQRTDSICAKAADEGQETVLRRHFLEWTGSYLKRIGHGDGRIEDSLATELERLERLDTSSKGD